MRTKLRFILLWIPILFQQLFMKKLLISSKLFVFLMSTINFSSLRLDNFIQLLNTSSVIIGLEFVFSNLCLTISVNLLSLSFQNNPDLLIFWAATRIFFDVWDEWIKLITNKSPCSVTDRRRLTGRQTFVRRVISVSTARCIFSLLGEQWWRERYTDGVMRVRGLFSPEDSWMNSSVVSEMQVVGLMTCERVVLGKGAKVLISESAQGACLPHHGRRRWRPSEWKRR